ncbi:MAG: sodium-dependent transporter [Deltaproteobacteria bacterium]|nr:sodium-dependent transporter [Deltaproteobacteria bacterium]
MADEQSPNGSNDANGAQEQDSGAASKRGIWGSKAGFILAAAGSAIGLGNIWRFPTEAANNGGAAFLLVYLACVVLIGLPVMLAEITLGRHTRKDPVGAFKAICPRSLWWLVGALGVVTGLAILSYYSVVAGWTLGYVVRTAGHTFTSDSDPNAIFGAFSCCWWQQILYHLIFMALCVAVVMGGVRAGIERWSKILMPTLLVMLGLLVVRSVTLPGAGRGLAFYLEPDFSKLDFKVIVAGLGQAFFSMSLGMGAMITYGSYLSRKDNLVTSATWVGLADTGIAILAGFMVLPALAIAGITPGVDEGGAGMIFTVLPSVFSQMPWEPYGGIVFGTAFFILLALAALTSAVSLLEVVTAYLVDERKWPRKRATAAVGGLALIVGVPSALGCGAVACLSKVVELQGKSVGFLELMDKVFGKLTLTLGALLISLVVGWVWGIGKAKDEIRHGNSGFAVLGSVWSFLLRFLCPLAIATILVFLIIDPGAIR